MCVMFLVLGCLAQDDAVLNNSTSIDIIPKSGEGINLAQLSGAQSPFLSRSFSLYTTIPDSYVVSEVINYNLDNDITNEQLVFYKNPSNGDDIHMLVIDYDRQRNSYIRAWEERLNTQNTASLNIDFADITSDGSDEILVYSRDQNNSFALDVFMVHFTSIEAIISLQKIGGFLSDSAIGIEQRDSLLLNGENTITSPQIVVEEQVLVGNTIYSERALLALDATLAQARENDTLYTQLKVYEWSAASARFIFSIIPLAANPEIDQQFFQQIAQAPVEDLLQIVAGNWRASNGALLMIIDIQNNTINIQVDQQQIAFQWGGQFKTISRGLPTIHMTLLNQNIPLLSKKASITLFSVDEINFNVVDELNLTHTYYRTEIKHSFTPPTFVTSTIALDGWYEGIRNGERVAMYFNGHNYILQDSSTKQKGTFVTYTLEWHILELTETDNRHILRTHAQYILSYDRKRGAKHITSTIQLTPIKLNFYGHQLLNEPPIQLLQTTVTHR